LILSNFCLFKLILQESHKFSTNHLKSTKISFEYQTNCMKNWGKMCEVGPPASRRPYFTPPIRASRSRGIPPCGAGRLPPPTAVQRQKNSRGDRVMYEFETNSGAKTIEAGIGVATCNQKPANLQTAHF
jgi:hypothetical protein